MGRATGIFAIAVGSGDAAGVRRIWSENPDLLNGTGLSPTHYLDDAIAHNHLEVLRALVEIGADINSQSIGRDDRGRAWCAVSNDATDCLEWLLQNNVRINFDTPEATRCFALECACAIGALDLVRQLIDHGAVTDYRWKEGDRPRGNPLTIAVNGGHEHVAEHLRSIGTPEPELPDQNENDRWDPLRAHLTSYFGEPEADEISQDVPTQPAISIVVIRSDDQTVLVTRGMSVAPITQGDGNQLYTELIMQVPADWAIGTESEDRKSKWAIACLQQLAVFPHISGQSFPPYLMCPNGMPPQPILEGHDFTGVLAIQAMAAFATYADGDNTVTMYHIVPLFTEEFDLAKSAGIGELLERFDARGVGQLIDLSRPNVAATL